MCTFRYQSEAGSAHTRLTISSSLFASQSPTTITTTTTDYPEYYRKPSSNAWHQPTAEAIFERLLNYEMDVGLDARAMDAFFERAQAEIKERLDFMDQFGEFQSVSERLDYIERRKQKAREEARFKDNLTM